MERKKFYVNLQLNEVNDYSVPGNNEYEIIANEEEVSYIKFLFNNLDHDSKQALSYIVNYVDENRVDRERENYSDNLIEIYKQLYELGTEETKLEVKKLNLFTQF